MYILACRIFHVLLYFSMICIHYVIMRVIHCTDYYTMCVHAYIGGESTRPGSEEVALQEEVDRVIPAIRYY